jgi:anti-sigma regulatory factor (Ser/Thr protein kinase)
MTDGHPDAADRRPYGGTGVIYLVARSHPAKAPSVGRASWADVFPLAKGRAALSVGAVDADGQPAARRFSEQLRAASRDCADRGVLSAVALSDLDAALADPHARATAVYAVHDSAGRSLELSSAGPCPPAIVTPGGSTSLLSSAASAPLGAGRGAYQSLYVPFPAGSSLVLYLHPIACPAGPPSADVLVSRISEARLSTRGRNSAGPVCTALASALSCEHTAHQTTVLLVRSGEDGTSAAPSHWFSASPESAAAARAFTLRVMDGWNLTEKANRAAVIVGELAANAIQHSAAPFEVRLHRTPGAVLLEVVDHNAQPPTLTTAGPYDAGRRGLTIVETLADRWGTRRYGPGKIVWAELQLEPRPRDDVLDPPPEHP